MTNRDNESSKGFSKLESESKDILGESANALDIMVLENNLRQRLNAALL